MASTTEEPPHPMVDVPDAIRKVLEVTAEAILLRSKENHFDEVPTNSPASQLLGRILADDVLMSKPGYPPYRASIMDGYAIQSEKYNPDKSAEWTHFVSGRVHAGPSSHETTTNDSSSSNDMLPPAVYITTGARVPDSYDCVVPIELIQESQDKTKIKIAETASVEPETWIRGVGCDIAPGEVVIPRGSIIHPVSLGLLQQSGQAHVKLVPGIQVGVLSTGNELLVSPDVWAKQSEMGGGGLIQTGQIPDVNKPVLQALLTSFGNCQPIDLGMERDDDIESMTKTIEKALDTCDVILTTGGISMGETDIVEDVLVRRLGGALHFGRLNMKPGKPTTFVTIQRPALSKPPCLVFALPGNPVSATVCTHLVVRPSLSMLQQYGSGDQISDPTKMVQETRVPPELTATLAHDIQLDMERPEYHRVTLETKVSSTGTAMEYVATSTGNQRSSRLMSLREAEGLLVLPKGTKEQPKALAGQQYTVLLLETSHQPVALKDSKHLNPKKPKLPTKVGVTQVSEDKASYPTLSNDVVSELVIKALSGSRSGSVDVVWCNEVTGSVASVESHFSVENAEQVDMWIVACSGSFKYCLELSKCLRKKVGKRADAMALQARQGAASQEGTAALFEPVVGFLECEDAKDGSMLIALPSKGLEGGLANVRGLLKHAVNVARGKPHNHHHHHQPHHHH